MPSTLRLILVIFFATNALFWGLFPHATHCAVAAALGAPSCPPHGIHIAFGFLCFAAAVATAQWSHFAKQH